ncbi:MAG TPA: hypothetical protein VE287_12500 [Actinopolymorphaceae bacterium]|nr:hypothetical protein [Actinopolymorphaceae bacterium]
MSDHRYRIVVAGVIGNAARQAFEGFKIEQVGTDTALRADLDQSALFGALNRVLSLGLELIEVIREDRDLAGGPSPSEPAPA